MKKNLPPTKIVIQRLCVLLRSIRRISIRPSKRRRLIIKERRRQRQRSLSIRDILSQKLRALIRPQKLSINLLEISTANKIVHVNIRLTQNFLDNLNIGIIVITKQSEALSAFESELALDSGVKLVGEGFEGDDEFDIESGLGFCLLEKDDFDESVDVGTV